MMRPNCLTIGLAVLLVGAASSFAQSPSTKTAIDRAVELQAKAIELQGKVADAQAAVARRDLDNAAKLYDQAVSLVNEIGRANLGPQGDAIVEDFTNVRLALARSAQSLGDYPKADEQLRRVLNENPRSQAAIQMKAQNDKMLAETAGTRPSNSTIEKINGWRKERVDLNTKVRDAVVFFEYGKLDEAEARLKQVLDTEPGYGPAVYYISLVKEAREKVALNTRAIQTKERILKVEQAWEMPTANLKLPVPNPYFTNQLIHTSQRRQGIVSKLDRLMINSFGPYDNIPLGEVIRYLSEEALKRDPDQIGINMFMANNADSSASAAPSSPAAPPAFDPTTGFPAPAAAVGGGEQMDMASITVAVPVLKNLRLQDALDITIKCANHPIKYSIEDYGIIFTLRGAEAVPLHTRIFKVDPNTFWMGLANVEGVSFGDVGGSSGGNGGGGRGGGRNGGNNNGGGFGGNNGGGGGGSDSGAMIPRVSVTGGSSGGGRNGGGRNGGGNFGNNNSGGGGGGLFSGGNVGNGLGGGQGNQGGGNFGNAGGQGSQGGAGGLAFITEQQSGAVIQAAVRGYFAAMGVDLSSPGKAVYFNDRSGNLFVRATLLELDIIEQAVQVLNICPPQVNIQAKFAEVAQSDKKALGFDWYLGNMLFNGKKIGAIGGTAPTFTGAPSAANPGGAFPGTSPANYIPSLPSDQLMTAGLRNSANAPSVATITGILTDPQFRVVIKALEQREGVELLSAPDVTTVSGRQAQLQVVDIRTIVTGNSLDNTGSGNGGNNNNNNNNGGSGGGVVAASSNYETQPLPFGPVLDVVPYVSADGYTVQLVIIPTITEFIGYDDPGQFIPQAQSVSQGAVGVPLTAQLPLPHFRVRQVTTTSIIWDGQTIVLGGLLSENVSKYKDKVPVIGDIPLLGKFFRSEANVTEKKNLLIFVTPTIIDPAGNRVHTDDMMPFGAAAVRGPMVEAGAATPTR